MDKTLIKLPIDATHSDGDGNVLLRITIPMKSSEDWDHYINLHMKDALLFQQVLATAINDEFGHFNSDVTS